MFAMKITGTITSVAANKDGSLSVWIQSDPLVGIAYQKEEEEQKYNFNVEKAKMPERRDIGDRIDVTCIGYYGWQPKVNRGTGEKYRGTVMRLRAVEVKPSASQAGESVAVSQATKF